MSHALFNALQKHFNCATDVELSKIIGLSTNHITAYRNGRENHGPGLILRMYDKTGWTIEHIRALLADKTPKPPSQRSILKARSDARKAAKAEQLAALNAKPAKPRMQKETHKPRMSYAEDAEKRLTVTKTAKWVSTVHRVL